MHANMKNIPCKFSILVLIVFCGSIENTRAYPRRQQFQEIVLQQQTESGCASFYSGGCCVGDYDYCSVNLEGGEICYCDQGCFATGECCSDIRDIGCYPMTCLDAMLPPGCCDWGKYNSCYVRYPDPHGGCYCDEVCQEPQYNDCCSDVGMNEQCNQEEEGAAGAIVQDRKSARVPVKDSEEEERYIQARQRDIMKKRRRLAEAANLRGQRHRRPSRRQRFD